MGSKACVRANLPDVVMLQVFGGSVAATLLKTH